MLIEMMRVGDVAQPLQIPWIPRTKIPGPVWCMSEETEAFTLMLHPLADRERPGNGHSGGKSVTDSGGLSLGPLWGHVSRSAIFSRSLVPLTHVTPHDAVSY
jgi:hypothetical protein